MVSKILGVNLLVNSCFESLIGYICDDERIKKFDVASKSEDSVVLQKGEEVFQIKYEENAKQVKLNLLDNDKKYVSNASSWLLDSENMAKKDLDFISKDFISTMVGKDKMKSSKTKKKSKSSDESKVTGLFFANRMVNIFPDLKAEIQEEKENYEEFRAATFAKEHILPKVCELLKLENEKQRINKLAKLLSDLYKNGTLDARSIITIVILNNIEDEKSIECLKSAVSEELLKAWNAALKYKGKTVKPEKPKKKSLLSKALEAQSTQNKR